MIRNQDFLFFTGCRWENFILQIISEMDIDMVSEWTYNDAMQIN